MILADPLWVEIIFKGAMILLWRISKLYTEMYILILIQSSRFKGSEVCKEWGGKKVTDQISSRDSTDYI